MRSRGRSTALFVVPSTKMFSSADLDDFKRYLSAIDKATTVFPLNGPAELQLNPDATTKSGGYKLTYQAFSQLSSALAPGLTKFLTDISGTCGLPDSREYLVDGQYAIDIWNQLVDLRFALVEQNRVIRNDKTRRIEGVVGKAHQYLENSFLYTSVSEYVEQAANDYRFFAAMVAGRRLSLWFRARHPMFSIAVKERPWPFYSGYYFANGESTGTSVRGTLAVFCLAGVCLAPYNAYGDRVTHSGRNFHTRLNQLLEAVTQQDIPIADIRNGAAALINTPLGFDAEMSADDRDKHAGELSHWLARTGLTLNQAQDVVKRGVVFGAFHDDRNPPLLHPDRVYPQRVLLDLFVPLLKLARTSDMSRRESIENVAFSLLTLKTKLPGKGE